MQIIISDRFYGTQIDTDAVITPESSDIKHGTYTYRIKSNVVMDHVAIRARIIGHDSDDRVGPAIVVGPVEANFIPAGLPAGVRMDAGQAKYIVSIYDNDYSPYTNPYAPGTFERPVPADNIPDRLINIQGRIPANGTTIEIPYHSYVSAQLKKFKMAIVVPGSHLENGVARVMYLEYPGRYISGNGKILARIHPKAGSGVVNIKKLDINAGLGDGSDRIIINHENGMSKKVYGVAFVNFDIPINSAGDKGEIQIRAMVGIPDRKFGQSGHMHLYLPITDSHGRVWLNNNIGATYANLDSSSFNLAKQGTSKTDSAAYGSRQNYAQAKNSCPLGWRLPTVEEYKSAVQLPNGWGIYAWSSNPFAAASSVLKLGNSGYTAHGYDYVYGTGYFGNYWTSQTGGCNTAYALHINACVVKIYPWPQTLGLSTRCIKN